MINQPHLLESLLKEEISLGERSVGSTEGTQYMTFRSRGLPEKCRDSGSGYRNQDEVVVSMGFRDSQPPSTWIQVIGERPSEMSQDCVLALAQEVREAESKGMRLTAGNLNRLNSGGHLYLEFSLEGIYSEGAKAVIQQEMRSNLGSHLARESIALMIFCVICAVWGLRMVFDRKGRKSHV